MSERSPRVIDFHVHVLEPEVLERSVAHNVATGFGARRFSYQSGDASARNAGRLQKMLRPELQIADMDARGIDMHVLSAGTVIQGTQWASPAEDLAMCRRVNDMIADWVARYPTRFVGTFTLPLQDMELALGELERAAGMGLKAANLSSNVGGIYLGDRCFDPFWAAMQARDLAAFIHPHGTPDPWFQQYSLWNAIGQPIEETKVMSSIIYEGVFDRYPRLKLVMAHGGGYLPHYFGRLDRNVENIPASVKNISRRPSDYLRSFYYDTCVYDPAILAVLIDRIGADRFVIGGDYPVGDPDPVGFARGCAAVRPEHHALIEGRTAAMLLGISA